MNKLATGTFSTCDRGSRGDLTGDGTVGLKDLQILMFNWGDCECCAADLNNDGSVGWADYFILTGNWTEESCAGLCGSWAFTCECDPICCVFNDCCPDFDDLCEGCD